MLKKILKKIRSLFTWQLYLLGLGIAIGTVLFIAGEMQKINVRKIIVESADQQLRAEAASIKQQIAYSNAWDLEGYRREAIDFSKPSAYYFIVDKNGVIGDIQGKPPKFRHVKLLGGEATSIRTELTPFNENWRLLEKKIQGGWVVVGENFPTSQSNAEIRKIDEELARGIKKFGNTIAEARRITTRHLNSEIDFAVLDIEGNYIAGNGGIPIIVDIDQFDSNDSKIHKIEVPIIGSNDHAKVASIVLLKDMGIELATIEELDKTNKTFALIIAVSTLGFGLIFMLPNYFRKNAQVSIDDALKVGEGKHIEFKSTFQCNFGSPEKVNEKRLVILKAIAGFLNGDGGTLFIGIMEQPPDPPIVRGLPEDLELVENNTDTMRLTLISLISDKIGKQFSDFITERIEERNGKLCWIIVVSRSSEPAFVKWKADDKRREQKHFYVREGPRTADLDLENTWRYIKNRWHI